MTVADLPENAFRAMAFIFGALWGSFFNVAIYRWPLGMSVVSPPSHCPACGAPVPAFRNLPIVAYLMQRGKAACCGAPLSARYLVVEVLGAVLCLAVFERFVLTTPNADLATASAAGVVIFFFTGALLVATFIDLEHTMIPDEVSLPGAALGLATIALRDMDAAEAAIGAGAGFLLIQLPFVWGYEHLFGRRGMGEGDSKLLMMIGAFIGWKGVVFSLLGGCVQGLLIVAGAMVLRRDVTAKDEYAFDPGPHADRSVPGDACLDEGGTATKLLKEAVEPKTEATEPVEAGLTLKRFLLTVFLFGGAGFLSLQHIQDPQLAELGAIIATTLGLSILALYALAGRRARAEEALAEEQAEGEAQDEAPALSPPRVAFGPFLALGALEWLFFGDQITTALTATIIP
ncbi:MAG: prepilin peptidase [Myxococcota bacterium]